MVPLIVGVYLTLSQPSFNTYIRLMRIYMGCFILGVNIKYMLLSILYGHINAPVACKEYHAVQAIFEYPFLV